MRVGFLHLGQSVDFVVSISFLRSPVFAIFAMGRVFLLLGVSLHTRRILRGFNGAAGDTQVSLTRFIQFTSRRFLVNRYTGSCRGLTGMPVLWMSESDAYE